MVTLTRVMEIARLEVSTQRHIDQIQSLQSSTMCNIGEDPRARTANQDLVVEVSMLSNAMEMLVDTQSIQEREGNPHYPWTSVGDVENQDIRRTRSARHLT